MAPLVGVTMLVRQAGTALRGSAKNPFLLLLLHALHRIDLRQ